MASEKANATALRVNPDMETPQALSVRILLPREFSVNRPNPLQSPAIPCIFWHLTPHGVRARGMKFGCLTVFDLNRSAGNASRPPHPRRTRTECAQPGCRSEVNPGESIEGGKARESY